MDLTQQRLLAHLVEFDTLVLMELRVLAVLLGNSPLILFRQLVLLALLVALRVLLRLSLPNVHLGMRSSVPAFVLFVALVRGVRETGSRPAPLVSLDIRLLLDLPQILANFKFFSKSSFLLYKFFSADFILLV